MFRKSYYFIAISNTFKYIKLLFICHKLPKITCFYKYLKMLSSIPHFIFQKKSAVKYFNLRYTFVANILFVFVFLLKLIIHNLSYH